MAIPGYDPDDLDDDLAERLDEERIEEYLTEEEIERLGAGERLLDLLDDDDVDRLLSGESRSD